MSVSVTCSCRRVLILKDAMAGKKGKCPSCGMMLQVPAVKKKAEEEIIDVQPLDDDDPPVKKKVVVEEEASGYSMAVSADPPRPRLRYEEEPSEERPKQRRPKYRSEIRDSAREGWIGNVHAGAVGGLLTMLVAVVWFVGGLAAGYIFFYPPVLFLIGLVAFIKGLTGGD